MHDERDGRIMKALTAILSALVTVVPTGAGAQVGTPQAIPYRGELTLNGGSIPDGTAVSMTFEIFDAPTGGARLWGPSSQVVPIIAGRFSVELGGAASAFGPLPAAVFSGGQAWLAVAVGPPGAEQPLSGRQRLLSNAYALKAEVAHSAEGSSGISLRTELDQMVPVGSVTAYFGTVAPPGWIQAQGQVIDAAVTPQLARLVTHLRSLGVAFQGDTAARALVPDLRGTFLRGVDGGRGLNPDAAQAGFDAPGHLQGDTLQAHTHVDAGHSHVTRAHLDAGGTCEPWAGCYMNLSYINAVGPVNWQYSSGIAPAQAMLGDPTPSTGGAPRASTETRPVNVTVLWIMKY